MRSSQDIAAENNIGTPKKRNEAIDFVKGFLVLLMVVYHVLNYLHYESVPHRYLGFLPCSFIMITGFLVTQVYFHKYKINPKAVGSRLAIRAIKLVLIFIVLNLAARIMWSNDRSETGLIIFSFFKNWQNIFIFGNIEKVAFDVLLPISYTLFFSIFILKFQGITASFTNAFAIVVTVLCIFLSIENRSAYNLYLLSSGIIGLALGGMQLTTVDKFANSWLFIAALILIYLALFFSKIDNYFSQIVTTFISLILFYALASSIKTERWWFQQVSLLGKFSLLSYIVQILFLQVTKNMMGSVDENLLEKTIMFIVITTLFTWLSVLFTYYAKTKSKAFAWIYNAVFA
jgi:hypothetical protein